MFIKAILKGKKLLPGGLFLISVLEKGICFYFYTHLVFNTHTVIRKRRGENNLLLFSFLDGLGAWLIPRTFRSYRQIYRIVALGIAK